MVTVFSWSLWENIFSAIVFYSSLPVELHVILASYRQTVQNARFFCPAKGHFLACNLSPFVIASAVFSRKGQHGGKRRSNPV